MENCLWIVFFMLFPDFNMGLLSDYKICGDPECESKSKRFGTSPRPNYTCRINSTSKLPVK